MDFERRAQRPQQKRARFDSVEGILVLSCSPPRLRCRSPPGTIAGTLRIPLPSRTRSSIHPIVSGGALFLVFPPERLGDTVGPRSGGKGRLPVAAVPFGSNL